MKPSNLKLGSCSRVGANSYLVDRTFWLRPHFMPAGLEGSSNQCLHVCFGLVLLDRRMPRPLDEP